MPGAREYREKAAHAARLARQMGPGDVADQLNALAVIYRERAGGMERSAERYPGPDVAEEQQQRQQQQQQQQRQPQPGPKNEA
jgi:hypothetical protein